MPPGQPPSPPERLLLPLPNPLMTDAMTPIQLLESRHSVRAYAPDPIDAAAVRTLQADITMINTHEAGMHFSLVVDDEAPLKSASGIYGAFRNARNFVACIVEPAYPDTYARAGYCAQQLAISALRLGLGSCFVAGTFNRDAVRLPMRAGWELPFILVLGNPDIARRRTLDKLLTWAIHRHSLPPRDLLLDSDTAQIDADMEFALRAVACAPSHLNKQPVRVRRGEFGPEAFLPQKTPSVVEQIDLGIARYNIDAALGLV